MNWLVSNAGVIGVLFFSGFWLIVATYLFIFSSKKEQQKHANIPLMED